MSDLQAGLAPEDRGGDAPDDSFRPELAEGAYDGAPDKLGLLPRSTKIASPIQRLLPLALRRLRFSRLTGRILAINIMVLLIPVFGLFWADQYYDRLVASELETLRSEGRLVAITIASAAVFTNPEGQDQLVGSRANRLINLLSAETDTRVRLFRQNGQLIADSSGISAPGGPVDISPVAGTPRSRLELISDYWRRLILPNRIGLPKYEEMAIQLGDHYSEVRSAFFGETETIVRQDDGGNLVLSIALPVTRYREVLGALMVSRANTGIDEAIFDIRITILQVFVVALALTVFLSLWLSNAIARPIISLANAADRVRFGKAHEVKIPDLSNRRDEIGDLSLSLHAMTEALWARLDAIESFAADVSHEIKNPLTSIKNAIATSEIISDPEKKAKLIKVAMDDIDRLDRLITDISDASRLDAELNRAQTELVDLGELFNALADSHNLTRQEGQPLIVLHGLKTNGLRVMGIEGRLGQVFRNLISNAKSFSPENGEIRFTVRRRADGMAEVTVEDEGPGLPPGKLEKVFDRFFTDRPEHSFGTHSGLGLSISRQIVEAHGGEMKAGNRMGPGSKILGARFTVSLPMIRTGG